MSDRPAREGFTRKLSALITADDTEAALHALRESLKATKPARHGRNSEGKPNYVLIPDYTIRICAANLLLQHAHGKPVQRNLMTVEHSDEGQTLSKEETIRRLAESLEHVVEIAKTYHEAANAIDSAKRVDQVIDADALPDLPEFPEDTGCQSNT